MNLSMWDSAVFDDALAIARAPLVSSASFDAAAILKTDFWGTDMYSPEANRSWRPLATSLFWLQHWVGGGGTLPFRLVNVSLRVVLVAVAFFWFRRLSRMALPQVHTNWVYIHEGIAAATACLIAAHPMHVDTYAFGVGQGDTLCAILVISCTMLRTQSLLKDLGKGSDVHWSWLGDVLRPSLGFLLLCVLAGAAKEIGAMLVPVLCCLDAAAVLLPAVVHKHSWRRVAASKHFARCAVLTLAWAGLMYLRLRVVQPAPPTFDKHMNPAAVHPQVLVRSLTLWWAAAWHFTSVLAPTAIALDWSDTCIQLVTSLQDWRNVTTLCFLGGAVCIAWYIVHTWSAWAESTAPGQLAVEGGHPATGGGGGASKDTAPDTESTKSPLQATSQATSKSVGAVSDASHASSAVQAEGRFVLATCSCAIISVVTFIPASNLFFTVGFLLAERIMLLPSLGMFGALVIAATRAAAKAGGAPAAPAAPAAGTMGGSGPSHTWGRIWSVLVPTAAVALAALAHSSMSRHWALNDPEMNSSLWLKQCPLSRKAWSQSARYAETVNFLWPTMAGVYQRGCHSSMGWLHDCGLQRERLLAASLNSFATPPTNCTGHPYPNCHPHVFDITQSVPAGHLVDLREMCRRSALAQAVPAVDESEVRFLPEAKGATVLSIPFASMSSAERQMCASALGPDKHTPLLILITMARGNSSPKFPPVDYSALFGFIQEAFGHNTRLKQIPAFDRGVPSAAMIAGVQHAELLLKRAAASNNASAAADVIQGSRGRLASLSEAAPFMMMHVLAKMSGGPLDPFLESTRMSGATQAIRINGQVNLTGFLHGSADFVLSILLLNAGQTSHAMGVLADRFGKAQCSTLPQAGGPADLFCQYCPLYAQFAHVYHMMWQELTGKADAEVALREAVFVAGLGWEHCTLGRRDTLETIQRQLAEINVVQT